MLSKNSTLLIWDLDGTLINSHPVTHTAFNQALFPYLGKELTYAEISKHYGVKEADVLASILGREHTTKSYETYLAACQNLIPQMELFLGIEDTLKKLLTQGYRLAIFTGRGREGTDLILKQFNISPHFEMIITNSELENQKPHPEGIQRICKKLGFDAADTYMIGDSAADIRAGRGAGSTTIGCLWDPICHQESLLAEKPHHVISKPAEIFSILEK